MQFVKFLRKFYHFVINSSYVPSSIATRSDIDNLKLMIGRQLASNVKTRNSVKSLEDVEFKIFSQAGEDGIIQFLINNIEILNKTFIEFGVENYSEANTRFLLENNNWSGLIIDGSIDNIDFIKKQDYFWRYDLKAVSAFITAENINDLIVSNKISGEIGILSIDIDGNDYWVWKAISCIDPVIVICEYNSVFGKDRAITVPYDPKFYFENYHYSGLYFGASLPALCDLATRKGYTFIGCNSFGSNAFFVRNDKLKMIDGKNITEGFVESKFRSSRSMDRKLSFVDGNERLNLIRGLQVFNVMTNTLELL